MKDRGYFSSFVCTGPLRHWLPISGDKNVLLFLVQRGHLSHGKLYGLLLERKGLEVVKEPFLHLLFPRFLQFKIVIHMPIWHIWGGTFWTTLSMAYLIDLFTQSTNMHGAFTMYSILYRLSINASISAHTGITNWPPDSFLRILFNIVFQVITGNESCLWSTHRGTGFKLFSFNLFKMQYKLLD